MIKNRLLAASVVAAMIIPTAAMATNGNFMMGNGTKANGRAGVGIGMADTAISGADNPAAMVRVGNRFDMGIQIFSPDRSAELVDTAGGSGLYDYDDDGNKDGPFYIPELGFNYMLNENMSLGLTVVGTGGMNTNYENLMFFAGAPGKESGINLEQVRILPTFSYKINDQHSVGISLQIAYQQFKAWGLGGFAGMSSDSTKLTDKGRDDSLGYGLSVGWQGSFMDDRLTVGVVYNSEIDMDKFSDYKGLLENGGDLDMPENYGIGIAFKATDDLLLAFDIQQINYSGVDAFSNDLTLPATGGPTLGSKNAAGFGWDDMTVYKLGAEYQWNKNLLLRAGYSQSEMPMDKDQTFFNVLAPAVVEKHATIGMTYTLPNESEISMFYMHSFNEKLNGSGSIPTALGGGEANIQMKQDAWGIAYGWNF